MNPRRKKFLIVSFLVIIYLLTGFFREYIFTNVNEQMRVTYYHDTDSHVSAGMQWLSDFNYSTLYYAKWPMTLFFTALFAFLAATTIKIAFNEKKLIRICWITYGAVFLLGFIFYFIGSAAGNPETTYEIARFLAGLTETPALLIIISAAFLAIHRE